MYDMKEIVRDLINGYCMAFFILYSFTIYFRDARMDRKIRNEKKKNTETGLLMGQNTNIFSQLSATYLQNKNSISEEEAAFVNTTQIVEYHDQKINRLISLLRKKAEVTKAKAATELKQEVLQMNEEVLTQFMPTFAQLYLEIVVNEQSKQVSDQFVAMLNHLLANHKKIVIKEISTIYGPFLILNRSLNISMLKSFSQLFTGTDEQLLEKGLILLLKKQTTRKFITLCKVILECEEGNKVGQQNYQRNCSCILKTIKDFIRNFSASSKRQELCVSFQNFIRDIDEIINGKNVQEFMKFGGKGKASLLEFYQCLISMCARNPSWDLKIQWERYAKVLCMNFLDKDIVVQQSLWKFCNKQFIESCLEIEKNTELKEKYSVFIKYLPKPEEKLLSCFKISAGATLYKQIANYCSIFPYTSFSELQEESHKSLVNKIGFIRKVMSTILEQEDENQARLQAYHNLCLLFLPTLNKIENFTNKLQEKKQQQILSLSNKAAKQLVTNLQEKYYANPPASRNSFSYLIPQTFCALLQNIEPQFDFRFDFNYTFELYGCLKKNTPFCNKIYDTIFGNCLKKPKLQMLYLENFPTREVQVDMQSDENENFIETEVKIFLLSKQAENEQNWFKQQWAIRKQVIAFDPRITVQDLASFEESASDKKYLFTPTSHKVSNKIYKNPKYDKVRFNFFLNCLKSEQGITLIPLLLPYLREELLPRQRCLYVNKLLQVVVESVRKLEDKVWMVGANEILRIRAISDIVIESLTSQDKALEEEINITNLKIFLTNVCQFILSIYNYKLDSEADQLLKLISKLIYLDNTKDMIFESARKSIKNAYEIFCKVGAKQEKHRRNRLTRLLTFVEKILWNAVDKKNKETYNLLMIDLLENNGWRVDADSRADLWLLGELVLAYMTESARKSITKQVVNNFEKYKGFLSLVFCCQMVLPLQRNPEAKKLFSDFQTQILKSISTSPKEQKLQLLKTIINQSTNSSIQILTYGAKTLLRSLLTNYHEEKELLDDYERICMWDILKEMENDSEKNSQGFIRKCLLLGSLSAQLPLLDLAGVQKVYESIEGKGIQCSGVESLSYLSISAVMWQAGVGVQNLSSQKITIILNKILDTFSNMKSEQNLNFIRFTALQILNGLYPVKGSQKWKQHKEILLKQLIWAKSQRGSSLHTVLQSSRFKFLSRIFSESDEEFNSQIALKIPEEMNDELCAYKEILDHIEEDQEGESSQTQQQHHENIVNMFIQFAEVLIRIAGGLSPKVKPNEDMILGLLLCPFPGIKKTAFILLKQMYELNLVQRNPPECFKTFLILDKELIDFTLDPMLANILTSYFFAWQAIIQRRKAIERPSEQEQSESILTLEDYLQKDNLYESFLKSVFEILERQLDFTMKQSTYLLTSEDLIEQDIHLQSSDLHQKIFTHSMRTLFMFILNFPLFLRDFMDHNKKYKNICDRLLRSLISDAIFKEEVKRIQVKQSEWKQVDNFEIYVTPNSKQIYAEYTHDVIRIGLRLVMRSNYPLSPIAIQFGEGLKLDEGSRWALMLQSQLHNKNNTIINGILLWKQNIDKKLAGVQQCAICFDIVNPQGQLPKKGCKTCKKKFHSVCIMKWFTKSNKSQCPLCKSQFL